MSFLGGNTGGTHHLESDPSNVPDKKNCSDKIVAKKRGCPRKKTEKSKLKELKSEKKQQILVFMSHIMFVLH